MFHLHIKLCANISYNMVNIFGGPCSRNILPRIDAIGGASFDVNGESQQYLENQSLTVTMYLKS